MTNEPKEESITRRLSLLVHDVIGGFEDTTVKVQQLERANAIQFATLQTMTAQRDSLAVQNAELVAKVEALAAERDGLLDDLRRMNADRPRKRGTDA